MDRRLLATYRKVRARYDGAKGRPFKVRGVDALRIARMLLAFESYEDQGLVRLGAEPDETAWIEDVACDRSCFASVRAYRHHLDECRRIAERDGIWFVYAEARAHRDDPWTRVDRIGAFLGDPFESDYPAEELKAEALDALDRMFAAEAEALAERATYAGACITGVYSLADSETREVTP